MKQIGLAAHMYMDDNDGALYHHHEDYVLDDGTQVHTLPADVSGCTGGGAGNSNAEKPWAIFFQPYLASRDVIYCPDDPNPILRSRRSDIIAYNGGISVLGQECSAAPNGEQCQAEAHHWAMWSYLLNSVFTHKSCRYVKEGVLHGFATEAAMNCAARPEPDHVLGAQFDRRWMTPPTPTGGTFRRMTTTPGLARRAWCGPGNGGQYANQGWIKYDRHGGGANYIFYDGHVEVHALEPGAHIWSIPTMSCATRSRTRRVKRRRKYGEGRRQMPAALFAPPTEGQPRLAS